MTPNIPSSPAPRAPEEEIDLFHYVNVILRRWKVFALAFSVVFIGVALYTFLMKPVYEATALLHVKEDKGKAGLLNELSLNATNPINAEIEIVKSRTNAEQVVRQLHLDWQVSKKSNGSTFKILDFTSNAERPVYRITLTGDDTFDVANDDGELIGQGKAGVLVRKNGFSLLLTDIKGHRGNSCQLNLAPFDDVVAGLQSGIKATEQGRQTGVIKISYASTDPVRARDVVNTLVQAYLAQSVAVKSEEASKAVGFVEEQLKGLRDDLNNAEKKLQEYKSATGMIKLDSEAEALIGKISQAEKARSELEVQKRAMLNDYTEAHPAVKAITRQQETITKQLASYENKMQNLPVAERDLANLTRISKVNADIYTFLLQKHEEARIAKASTISNINIVDPAIVPNKPIKPKKAMNLLLGLIIGLALGIGLAFFQEYLDDTIKNADEAKRVLGLPLLATIPHISGRERVKGSDGSAPLFDPLIAQNEPKSIAAEAFRALRTSLHFSAINREKKIMLLTSSFPGEGKSIISANLAAILCQTGARVLIVDCDLRRSSLHEKFGLSKTPGLSELLTGDITFLETRQNTVVPGLDMIAAGTTPPNPAELLGSEAMRNFLLSQRQDYDHIIVDAPPVLAVTDAPVLTSVADVVILVMEAGRVPIKAAQHMRETLININAPVAGLVINDKTGKGESYGYYGGRYYRYGKGKSYGYGYGYGYYSDEEKSKSHNHRTWWSKILPKAVQKIFK